MRRASAERRRAAAWAAVAAWTGVILVLSTDSFSSRETSRILGPVIDFLFPGLDAATRALVHAAVRKGAHVVEYAVLGALCRGALRNEWPGRELRAAAVAVGLVAAVAGIDEAGQAARDERTGSPADVALDVAGGAAGIVAARLASLCARRKREVAG